MNENNDKPMIKDTSQYVIGNTLSNRISLMRGILTLMVVNIHSINLVVHFQTGDVSWGNAPWLTTIEYLLSEVVSRAAVPAFFFISALMLYKKDFLWIENAKKKTRSLVVPYLIVNTFWVVVYFVLQSIPSLSAYFTMEGYIIRNWDIMGWLKGYGFFSAPLVAPLWFIRDLFVLNLLSIVIKKLIGVAPGVFAVILLLFWISPFSTHIFCLNKQALCFWCFGYLCVYYRYNIEKIDKFKGPWLILVYLLALVLDVELKNYSFNWIIHNTGIIVGVVFWFVYGTTIKKEHIKKIILLISEYSFGVYLFHQLTLNCINKVYARLMPPSSLTQLIGYLLVPAAVIVGCIAFSAFLKKHMVRLYRVLFGKPINLFVKE